MVWPHRDEHPGAVKAGFRRNRAGNLSEGERLIVAACIAGENPKTILLGLLSAALLVRLVAIYSYGPSKIGFEDTPDYLSAASTLCTSGSYPEGSSMPFFRAPGLPFFIAAVTFCRTETVWLVKA